MCGWYKRRGGRCPWVGFRVILCKQMSFSSPRWKIKRKKAHLSTQQLNMAWTHKFWKHTKQRSFTSWLGKSKCVNAAENINQHRSWGNSKWIEIIWRMITSPYWTHSRISNRCMNINVVKTGSDWFSHIFTFSTQVYLWPEPSKFWTNLSSTKEIINCGFSRLANFLTNKFASYLVNIVSKLCKISVFQCPNLCFICQFATNLPLFCQFFFLSIPFYQQLWIPIYSNGVYLL